MYLTQPGLRAAIARRSTLLFYLAAAVGLWWLTLGPSATFAGVPLRWPSPYALLATVPGFAGLRVPARLFMLVVLCLSAAASLAYARVPLAPRWRPAVLTVTFALTVADGWVLRLPLVPAPAPWPAMVTHGSARPLLQLPGAPRQPEPVAMYRAALVQRPLVNGYSGHFPPAQAILVHAVGMYDLTVLDGPSAREPLDILLDRSRDFRGGSSGGWATRAQSWRGGRVGGACTTAPAITRANAAAIRAGNTPCRRAGQHQRRSRGARLG